MDGRGGDHASPERHQHVADGVGSYSELGVDAGAFSRSLMEIAGKKPLATGRDRGEPICPYRLLEQAYEETVRSHTQTCPVGPRLLGGGHLPRRANLGDGNTAASPCLCGCRRYNPQAGLIQEGIR
jgi:hypothetical protein